MKIEFFKHNISENDINRVNDVLHSIFLTNANVTREFESKLSEYLGVKHCIAVNSCTAALHLSLLALDIGLGDEVITTPFSFVATANSILHAGAIPVFVDVELETGNIDISKIEEKITPKTKAIMPVHLYGHMVDMEGLKKIADTHKLQLIEDGAHCIEGLRDGIKPGNLSDTACFSFYATKNITSGEGGAIVCNDNGIAEKLYRLRSHGINRDAGSRYTTTYKHYDMECLGWKYNPTDIQSALLLGQLEHIEALLLKREQLAKYYESELDKLGIKHHKVLPNNKSARHLFTILVENRDEILWQLQEKGIGVAVNYRPIHLHSFYKNTFGYKAGDFPNSEYLGERTLSLPLYPLLREEEAEYVIETLGKMFW